MSSQSGRARAAVLPMRLQLNCFFAYTQVLFGRESGVLKKPTGIRLETVLIADDVRSMEKRNWRSQVWKSHPRGGKETPISARPRIEMCADFKKIKQRRKKIHK